MGRNPVKRPSNPVDGGPMLKMKELVEATGISKATILFYLSEKLLPQPVKTSPNIAYYPSSTIERIQLIRELQSKHRFSLAQIRTILQGLEKGRDLETMISFNKEVFGEDEERPMDRETFLSACGLSKKQLQAAIDLKLLIPKFKDRFDAADLGEGKLLKESLALGVTFEDLSYYARLAEEMVAHEMALRNRLIRGMSYEEAMAVTLKVTHHARFFRQYAIERTFMQQALKPSLKQDVE